MLNEDGPLAYGDPEVISLQKSPQAELPSPDWVWIIHFQFRGLRGSHQGEWFRWENTALEPVAASIPAGSCREEAVA